MKIENKKEADTIFTIPNIISFVRIVLVVIAGYELAYQNNNVAFALYFVAIVTDFFDGFFARKLNQISELGKILDPIADKLMVISASIILMYQDRMPIWFVAVILGRDIILMLGGLVARRQLKFVIPSIFIGKISAVLIMSTFILNIINFSYIQILYCLSSIAAIISLFAYAINTKRILAGKDTKMNKYS